MHIIKVFALYCKAPPWSLIDCIISWFQKTSWSLSLVFWDITSTSEWEFSETVRWFIKLAWENSRHSATPPLFFCPAKCCWNVKPDVALTNLGSFLRLSLNLKIRYYAIRFSTVVSNFSFLSQCFARFAVGVVDFQIVETFGFEDENACEI